MTNEREFAYVIKNMLSMAAREPDRLTAGPHLSLCSPRPNPLVSSPALHQNNYKNLPPPHL